MRNSVVKKAVIPAAGFGTRMLPFTKAVPKELIPLVDKPVIQYVVEEAAASGIEDILIVISSGKEAILRHFNPAFELEQRLEQSGKELLLGELREIGKGVNIQYVYQQQLNGLGDAVRYARSFAGNEPFALLLGDTVMDSTCERPVIGQLIDVYSKYNSSVVAVSKVEPAKLSSYGVVGGTEAAPGITKISKMVEKPAPDKAPGNLAVTARYVFTPAIFDALADIEPGVNGELQLTDAMVKLLGCEDVYGCEISGVRYDLGSKAGFIAANVEFALRDRKLKELLGVKLENILKEKML